MHTSLYNKHSKRRNVLTMAKLSLSTVALRCCEPRKVLLRNSRGSWLIFAISTPSSSSVVGICEKNSLNDSQKPREISAPHTSPSGMTRRRRWQPDPVHCSTQPPVRAFVLPSRSPDSTRLAWSRVESPLCARAAALQGARQPLTVEKETPATSLRPAKTATAHPASAGGACSTFRSSTPGVELPGPSDSTTNFYSDPN